MKVQKKHKTQYIVCMKPQKPIKKESQTVNFSIKSYLQIVINKLKYGI
ncbi:MAG: hypothetical protein ACJAVA_000230 [Flavobacteriaceae bacterium]|jgi:hypothetical protein